jgi:hypothetical protein
LGVKAVEEVEVKTQLLNPQTPPASVEAISTMTPP